MGVGPRGIVLWMLPGIVALAGAIPVGVAVSGAQEEGAPIEDHARQPDALMLFVSYRDRLKLSVSPTEVRLSGYDLVAASATAYGGRLLPNDTVLPLLRDWRIRTSSSIARGFLDALASQHGCRHVLVADLILYADRLLLSVRRIDALTGRLMWLETVEGERRTLSEVSEKWRVDLARACERLDWREMGPVPRSNATPIVVLPVEPVGASAPQADWATRSLLLALLTSGDWLVPDPALSLWALQYAGCEAGQMDEHARGTLMSRFRPAAILVPELLTFALAPGKSNLPSAFDEDDEIAWPSSAEGANDPAYLTLLVIDGQTGLVFLGGGEYVPVDPSAGLFGVPIDRPQSRRFEKAAGSLLQVLPSKRRND